MKTQELKNAVLQYAIQGKLAPQNPADETASILLDEIKKEREQLIKEKKIKNPQFWAEVVIEEKYFEIPGSWQWVRLGEVGETCIGLTYSPKDISSNGIVVLRSNNIKNGKINLDEVITVQKEVKEKLIINKNDILICSRNGSRALVGKSGIIKDKGIGMTFGAFMAIYRSKCNDYISWFLSSPLFRQQLQGCTTTTINQLTQEILMNLHCPLPPFREQKRIADKVEELMSKIDEYDKVEQQLSSLETNFPIKLKKSIIQYAVQGKLVPQNRKDEPASALLDKIRSEKEQFTKEKKTRREEPIFEITDGEKPFDIPESWEWVRLEDVSLNIHYGYTASAQSTGNSKLLRITDIQDNRVIWSSVPSCQTTEKEFRSYGLNNRDILIARTGGTIGKSYLVRELKERAVFASYLIRVIPASSVNELYLKRFLESPFYWEQLKAKSIGTGQPNVNGNTLKNLLVALPPLAEQQRIVDKVEQLMNLCDTLSAPKSLEEYKVKKKVDNVIPINRPTQYHYDEDEFDMVARADSISPETQKKISERIQQLRTKK